MSVENQEIPYKKLLSGFSLPVLGIGTAYIGGIKTADYSNDTAAIAAIKKSIDCGLRHIDTSELYGDGHAEELVAEAIKDYDRTDFVISTKVFRHNLHKDTVIRSAKNSMQRLGIAYIDLYSIHAPNTAIPLVETMTALDQLVAEGLVRNIGVSNFSVQQLKQAQSLTKNKIVANQFEFNLAVRERSQFHKVRYMESQIIPYCQANDILVVAACPLGRGIVLQDEPVLTEIAKRYKKTKAQVAINWLLAQKNVVVTMRTTSLAHVEENIGSLGWSLEPKDFEILTKRYPSDRSFWRRLINR